MFTAAADDVLFILVVRGAVRVDDMMSDNRIDDSLIQETKQELKE